MSKEQNLEDKDKALHIGVVMPCFVLFKDRNDIEHIGIAENIIDNEYFAVTFNSTRRGVCKYTDATICRLNKA